MRLLLDTHALLWWVLDAEGLSKKARSALKDFNNEVYVSAATAWEIAIKFRIGRLPEAESFVHSFGDNLRKLGFAELPISVEHAQRAGLLPGEHKDPFDRMLIAQAQTEGFQLISNETLFDAYHVHRLW
jgi:PIN domain nuclease of toxin-antitoxin system